MCSCGLPPADGDDGGGGDNFGVGVIKKFERKVFDF